MNQRMREEKYLKSQKTLFASAFVSAVGHCLLTVRYFDELPLRVGFCSEIKRKKKKNHKVFYYRIHYTCNYVVYLYFALSGAKQEKLLNNSKLVEKKKHSVDGDRDTANK